MILWALLKTVDFFVQDVSSINQRLYFHIVTLFLRLGLTIKINSHWRQILDIDLILPNLPDIGLLLHNNTSYVSNLCLWYLIDGLNGYFVFVGDELKEVIGFDIFHALAEEGCEKLADLQ